eukprot:1161515-Pelagomonas_calceolata.AAC.17
MRVGALEGSLGKKMRGGAKYCEGRAKNTKHCLISSFFQEGNNNKHTESVAFQLTVKTLLCRLASILHYTRFLVTNHGGMQHHGPCTASSTLMNPVGRQSYKAHSGCQLPTFAH